MYHTRPAHDFQDSKACIRPTGMHITTLQLFSRSPTNSTPKTTSLAQSSSEPGHHLHTLFFLICSLTHLEALIFPSLRRKSNLPLHRFSLCCCYPRALPQPQFRNDIGTSILSLVSVQIENGAYPSSYKLSEDRFLYTDNMGKESTPTWKHHPVTPAATFKHFSL